MTPSPRVFILRHRFDDFDAFCEAGKGWHIRFRQLDQGRFIGEMDQVVTGPVAVIRCRLNRKIEQLGNAPPGCRTFGVTQPDHVPFRWRRYGIEPGDLMGFAEDVGMDCQSAPGFHLFAVSIAEQLLADAGKQLGMGSHESVLRREHVVRPPEHLMRALRRRCRTATGFKPQGPASEQAFAAALESELPRLILRCFAEGERKLPVLSSLGRRRALRRAMEVIRGAAEPIQSVAELCRLTGESARMLGYAFNESFGMSPKAYLQVRRLNAVRRELLVGEPDTLVTDAANGQGFWHMGQFAADYRKMFGELPSATLRRRRG